MEKIKSLLKSVLRIDAFLHLPAVRVVIDRYWPVIKLWSKEYTFGWAFTLAEKVYLREFTGLYGITLADEARINREAGRAAFALTAGEQSFAHLPDWRPSLAYFKSQFADFAFHDEQGQIGTCACHQLVNMVRQVWLSLGLKPKQNVSHSLLYKWYRLNEIPAGVDTGTYVDFLYIQVAKYGVPLSVIDEIYDAKDLMSLDTRVIDGREYNVVYILNKENPYTWTADIATAIRMAALKPNVAIQMSTAISPGYWNDVVKQVFGPEGIKGRHSCTIVNMTKDGYHLGFNTDNGEPVLFIRDSAFNKYRGSEHMGFRRFPFSELAKSEASFRIPNLLPQIEERLKIAAGVTPKPSDVKVVPVKYGERSDAVKFLQERLINLKFKVSSATGYYGDETAAAVGAWKRKQYGVFIDKVQERNFYQYDCDTLNKIVY